MNKLYEKSKDIQNELRNVQHLIIDNNLRWMDVELALASGQKQSDNTIIDGFKTVENTANAFSDTDLGPAAMTNKVKRKRI